MDPCPFPRVGPGRFDRNVLRPVSDAQGALSRDDHAHALRAALTEPPVAGDPTSSQKDRQLPTYNAYSIDGDVTAPLVYVNYGVPADYERLERLGVDVHGKIVIARYGQSWRGIKPKLAAEHGAVGCLIYSDPRDDGYFEGEAYPKGAYRPEQGVQRGSVADMPMYSGDPLTPGVGATKIPEHWKLSDAKTLTKIPVLPISYGDARPLLAALSGPVAPTEWRGALPLTYHVGSGARAGSFETRLRLEDRACPGRGGAHSRFDVAGGVGHPRETTTTPGSTERPIPSAARRPCSRRLGPSAS